MSEPARALRQPKWWLTALFFALVAAAMIAPSFRFPDRWGDQYDWRYFQTMEEVNRLSVAEYHQVPLWNPYVCGGEVGLANPQSTALAPTVLLSFAFGTPVGLKLALFVYLLCALHGAYLLARQHGVSGAGAVVSGLAFGTSGWFALHLATGHINFAGAALFPYLLVCYRKSLDGGWHFVLPAGGLVAWMAALGGTYTAPMGAILLATVAAADAARARSLRPLAHGAAIGLVGLLAGAARLLPVLEFVRDHPRHVVEQDGANVVDLLRAFFVWQPSLTPVARHVYWWHEYCCHLTAVAALLALVAALGRTRRRDLLPGLAFVLWTALRLALPRADVHLSRYLGYRDVYHVLGMVALVLALRRGPLRPILPILVVALGIAVGRAWPFGPWWLLRKLPLYHDLRVPSRYLILVALAAAVAAGVGFDLVRGWLARGGRRALPVAVLATLAIAAEGAWFSASAYQGSFPVLSDAPSVRPPFHQEMGDKRWMFAAVLENRGSLDCDEEAPLQRAEALDTGAVDQVRLVDPAAGTARMESWSPNRVVIAVDLAHPTDLLVNENWNEHWTAETLAVEAIAGRLAVALPAGRRTVVLEYRPRSFVAGAWVSLLFLPLGGLLFAAGSRTGRRRNGLGGSGGGGGGGG